MKTQTKSIKKRANKAIVTQDNRFIYAKYDMNANEMKFFMWIVAQLNSQKEQLFQVCEIPLSEIFQVWQWGETSEGYNYVRDLCYSMAKKAYVEDFKLLDEKTMKEKSVFQAMPLFKFIRYEQGQSYVTYQLNDSLTEYLLDLKRDFTQLKFSDIQQMKSAYSIRIYNMLVCELKQNRQSLKMNLAVLQNILEVPKSLQDWQGFQRRVLAQAKKDINAKSNLILLDIKTFKTGRKITDLEFIFDYKNNDKRIQRDKEKQDSFNEALIKAIESYAGKSIYFKDYGELIYRNWQWENNDKKRIFAVFTRKSDEKLICFLVKNFKDINALQKAKDKAEEMFYLDTEAVKAGLEFKKKLEQGSLFNLNSLLSPKK
ncbi:replication initiation protein [Helicobacter turcicus]|uniref:Replication initiation protein n=1 Tax=Helicobacter turcicus TaxID=2867412 RepID=A0ABS7JQB1_9HELI|nr:replication initiation protein [Helicobacter turcicus]MBX7491552.1 replication initiation protein [Helicobacter turcicus]MBX7546410.1 replication initiation protein [Helicobacter turcicus]